MPRRNSTVKIVDGKVVFSKEILEYFESIRNGENSIWIDKYFEYLSDESNLSATKYNLHHIRPCCTFKDEEHKNRKETLPLGDAFKGNIIKISVYNHLLSHYCLWKIFDTRDTKDAIQRMCVQEKYVENLTEAELKEIAKLQEECAKENRTEEEKKEYMKEYCKQNKDKILKRANEWAENNQDRVKKNKDNWYQRNKEKISQKNKENREELRIKERERRHKNKERIAELDARPCRDPIRENEICTWNALRKRKHRNKELYKNVILPNCLIKDLMIIPQPNA